MTEIENIVASLKANGFVEILHEPYELDIVGAFNGSYRIYARTDLGLLVDFSSFGNDKLLNGGHMRGEVVIPSHDSLAYEKFRRYFVDDNSLDSQCFSDTVDVFSADIRYTDPVGLIRMVNNNGLNFASPWRHPRAHHLWLESPADKIGVPNEYHAVVSAIQSATGRRIAAFPGDVLAFMTVNALLER